jgi:hypothetical protein
MAPSARREFAVFAFCLLPFALCLFFWLFFLLFFSRIGMPDLSGLAAAGPVHTGEPSTRGPQPMISVIRDARLVRYNRRQNGRTVA